MQKAFELALLMALHDIKYRTRILVENGVTLIGVVDETGFLKEGEIYAHTETPEGDDIIIEGNVMITRSPVHHPGDIQMAKAVMPPTGSPLLLLRNCVAFSIHGYRPLPSMLAGIVFFCIFLSTHQANKILQVEIWMEVCYVFKNQKRG